MTYSLFLILSYSVYFSSMKIYNYKIYNCTSTCKIQRLIFLNIVPISQIITILLKGKSKLELGVFRGWKNRKKGQTNYDAFIKSKSRKVTQELVNKACLLTLFMMDWPKSTPPPLPSPGLFTITSTKVGIRQGHICYQFLTIKLEARRHLKKSGFSGQILMITFVMEMLVLPNIGQMITSAVQLESRKIILLTSWTDIMTS